MSMIYDALRSSQSSTPQAGKTAGARIQLIQRIPPYALWLAAGVMLAGPAGYLIARSVQGTAPALVAASPIVPASVLPVAAALPFSAPVPLDQAEGKLANETAAAAEPIAAIAAPTMAPAAVAAISTVSNGGAKGNAAFSSPADLPSTSTEAATTRSSDPRPALPSASFKIEVANAQVQQRPSSRSTTTADEPDPAIVRSHMGQLHAAVASGDPAASAQALQKLESVLPAHSLTLLRARAWAAHGSGDAKLAEQHYSAILARVPEDEHAGVNLALLEARRGADGEARARLNRLAARNTRSAVVSQALQDLENASP